MKAMMILPLVQIKKYGGKVLADTNGKQALRLVPMEKNARYPILDCRKARMHLSIDFLIKQLHLKGTEKILDLACGFGRHSLEFARRGYDVTGIDITPAYIDYANEQAKKENLNAKFICQDIRTITFDEEFDVVLNMADGAIGYLEDDGENHKIFSVIAKALKNGGKHFMDIMNGSYAQTHFPCKLWDAGEKGLTLSAFEWEKDRKTLIYGQVDYIYKVI